MWDYTDKVKEYFFNPKNVGVLADADAEVACAAAVALGHIGGQQAADALQQALAGPKPEVRSAAAEGCVLPLAPRPARNETRPPSVESCRKWRLSCWSRTMQN